MNSDKYIQFNNISVSLIELRVWVKDTEIHFTLSELRLLLVFLADPYRTISRDELIKRVDLMSISALHTLINRVRTLLDQQYIFTVRGGVGYSFTEPTRISNTVVRGE